MTWVLVIALTKHDTSTITKTYDFVSHFPSHVSNAQKNFLMTVFQWELSKFQRYFRKETYDGNVHDHENLAVTCLMLFNVNFCIIHSVIPGGYKPLIGMISSVDMWTELLQRLSKDGHWHIIYVLLNGNSDIEPLMTEYRHDRATDVKLHSLLEKSTPEHWTDWGEKLAIIFLDNGTPHKSLTVDGKHSLHAALKVGMRTGIPCSINVQWSLLIKTIHFTR